MRTTYSVSSHLHMDLEHFCHSNLEDEGAGSYHSGVTRTVSLTPPALW